MNENSDTFVMDVLDPSKKVWARARRKAKDLSWTQLMDWCVGERGDARAFIRCRVPTDATDAHTSGELHDAGHTKEDMRAALIKIPVLQGALVAVELAKKNGAELRCLSDANEYYIGWILEALGVRATRLGAPTSRCPHFITPPPFRLHAIGAAVLSPASPPASQRGSCGSCGGIRRHEAHAPCIPTVTLPHKPCTRLVAALSYGCRDRRLVHHSGDQRRLDRRLRTRANPPLPAIGRAARVPILSGEPLQGASPRVPATRLEALPLSPRAPPARLRCRATGGRDGPLDR